MKQRIISILKVIIPVSLGIYLIFFIYNKLTDAEKEQLFEAFKIADYKYVLIGMFLGWLSHLSRAYRWNFLLEPMGYKSRFWNNYHAVMVGYVMNIMFPRLGEASRCAVIAKYENIPFNKLFGSVLAERVIDMIILLIITFFTLYLQLDLLHQQTDELITKLLQSFTPLKLILLLVAGIGGMVGLWIIFKKFGHIEFIQKIKKFVYGLVEGLQSVLATKKKIPFLLHTILIWSLYIGMFYISFFALESTAHLPLGAVLAGFVFGSFAIVLVQGGIGVYPVIIMETLYLYGINKAEAFAMGWIIWTSQTLLIVALGGLSMFLLPFLNEKKLA
ncbi:MAG: UPF0104 family protein [Bacteroidetes bacterium]|nr:MAG: UPF0104 family protein [Bacteroidota bacterium]